MQFHLDIEAVLGDVQEPDEYVLVSCRSCIREAGVPFGVAHPLDGDNSQYLPEIGCPYCNERELYPANASLQTYAAEISGWSGKVLAMGVGDWVWLDVVPEPEAAAA